MHDFLVIATAPVPTAPVPTAPQATAKKSGPRRTPSLSANAITARARKTKATMAEQGITQIDLTEEFGLHRNTINNAINHGQNHDTLIKILDRLGLPRNLAS